jgi:hypothetical protein
MFSSPTVGTSNVDVETGENKGEAGRLKDAFGVASISNSLLPSAEASGSGNNLADLSASRRSVVYYIK